MLPLESLEVGGRRERDPRDPRDECGDRWGEGPCTMDAGKAGRVLPGSVTTKRPCKEVCTDSRAMAGFFVHLANSRIIKTRSLTI